MATIKVCDHCGFQAVKINSNVSAAPGWHSIHVSMDYASRQSKKLELCPECCLKFGVTKVIGKEGGQTKTVNFMEANDAQEVKSVMDNFADALHDVIWDEISEHIDDGH
jgi:hypothetical protein